MSPTMGLDAAMEAVALNTLQERRLQCIVDSFPALMVRRGVPGDILRQLVDLCRELMTYNALERECERQLAELLQAHAARARALPASERLTAKSIARRLRDPLKVLAQPRVDSIAYFRAASAVRDVMRAVPRDHLLSAAVAHELGKNFTLLVGLAGDDEMSSW